MEPIVRVQWLSEKGIEKIPECYVKPASERPNLNLNKLGEDDVEIPVIDMSCLYSEDGEIKEKMEAMIDGACKEWGFLQLVNHGVSQELMGRVRELWMDFFKLPFEEKEKYLYDPLSGGGYGSRIGYEKGQLLDWRDFFRLYHLPEKERDEIKWPTLPLSLRESVVEYLKQAIQLSEKLLRIFSLNLGLRESHIQEAFGGGGDDVGVNLLANYYPKCPQPDLALGLSPHSDLGGVTILMPDYDVPSLQVRRGDKWTTVKAIPSALIVNLGDQLQILSNGIYQSAEHRVIANSTHDRFSLVVFYNPNEHSLIKPIKELVTPDRPQMYPAWTYGEHKHMVTTNKFFGKSHMKLLQMN